MSNEYSLPLPTRFATVPLNTVMSFISNPLTSIEKIALTDIDCSLVMRFSVDKVTLGAKSTLASLHVTPSIPCEPLPKRDPWLPLPVRSIAKDPESFSKRQYPTS